MVKDLRREKAKRSFVHHSHNHQNTPKTTLDQRRIIFNCSCGFQMLVAVRNGAASFIVDQNARSPVALEQPVNEKNLRYSEFFFGIWYSEIFFGEFVCWRLLANHISDTSPLEKIYILKKKIWDSYSLFDYPYWRVKQQSWKQKITFLSTKLCLSVCSDREQSNKLFHW
jgi:hypothetical protein